MNNQIKLTTKIDRFRFLWKNSKILVILIIMIDLGSPLTTKKVCQMLGVNRETIIKCFHLLSDLNLVARPHINNGWMLTSQGFEFMRFKVSEKPTLPLTSITTTL